MSHFDFIEDLATISSETHQVAEAKIPGDYMQVDLSIVIPAYNEEIRLPEYLDSILAYFQPQQDMSYEIIVVDDGSTDSTAAVVVGYMEQNSNVKLICLPHNRGKGYAVRTGMLQARGKLRLFADADGATPITELERLKKKIKNGMDVAVASRALSCDLCTVNAQLHRKIIGTAFQPHGTDTDREGDQRHAVRIQVVYG